LALTASVSDAVLAFMTQSVLPLDADEAQAEKVAEAGECFARGLALLIGTQFEQVYWNPESITARQDRWRVRFTWAAQPARLRTKSDGPIQKENDDADL
jgi:hypothetical protein